MIDKLAKNTYAHMAVLVLVGLAVYSNTFHSPFHGDDKRFIVESPLIRDFSYFMNPSSVEYADVDGDIKRYFESRYVGILSFWASFKLFGLELPGYHAINLAIHIINSMMVYFIVTLTLRTPLLCKNELKGCSGAIALFTGLLFAIHPLQTEPVLYILQRLVLMAAMFYLLSTMAYAGARLSVGSAKRYALYALALVSALLGMKTKENVFTLPVVIALYELMFFRGGLKKRLLYLLPFLSTMLIIPLTYARRYPGSGGIKGTLKSATWLEGGLPRDEYFFTQLNVIVSYMKLLFLPVKQTVDHYQLVYRSFSEPVVIMSFLFILGIIILGIYLLKRSLKRESAYLLAAYGIFWYFVALSVESSILPIGELMCEYRTYLPNAGAYISIAVVMFIMYGRLREPWTHKAFVSMLIALLIVLAVASHARNNIWRTSKSLNLDIVKKAPLKPRGHLSLGVTLLDEKQYNEAIHHFKRSLELKTTYYEKHPNVAAWYNLGLAYYGKGMLWEAIRHYETALEITPDDIDINYNLAIAYNKVGMKDKAIEYYLEALKINPSNNKVRFNLALMYLSQDRNEQARKELEEVLKLEPWNRRARQFLEYVSGVTAGSGK